MSNTPRPQFLPTPCPPDSPIPPLIFTSTSPIGDQKIEEAIPVIQCPADFPLSIFEEAAMLLVNHPEYNSTLILRSELIATYTSPPFPPSTPQIKGYEPTKAYYRKLLPRRPTRDASLEQLCTLYTKSPDPHELEDMKTQGSEDDPLYTTPTLLVLTPLPSPSTPLPYYHPQVSQISFHLHPPSSPTLLISLLPLPPTSQNDQDPTNPSSRLHRTSLSLLQTLHRYLHGTLTSYKKRTAHDLLIPRDEYQDLYGVMRERHKGLVEEWREVTDPLKHVFEDIGIATYLMLLWKDTFPPEGEEQEEKLEEEPWKKWGRPPGGFLDLGCGNALLTHILLSEGYKGYGIDVRARKSWDGYPESTRERLVVGGVDPLALVGSCEDASRSCEDTPSPSSSDQNQINTILNTPQMFLIANHADELTPWVPVLSTLMDSSGYISIPCCAWAFDERFTRGRGADEFFEEPSSLQTKDARELQRPNEQSLSSFITSLSLGSEGSSSSSYSSYRIWLAGLSGWCGWVVECDNLRIPSTRNWAVVGRKKLPTPPEQTLERAKSIILQTKERGLFRVRKPEGKAGEH
ncbi:hypothetical protein JAAARDRAFT_125782 [Jaapia argillacea MUCL 33604]|uniref:tRNA (uracil-O(2)-)-methyltransferase n=1 Tax=Jaapia argillacea MUCL 33604 TaxID=933084 RepID=A0A067Q2U0_9AGAM|nr:hypothetical protein JAAARDRAFT_125782 [Jaapia argillacea MUCL 33604]